MCSHPLVSILKLRSGCLNSSSLVCSRPSYSFLMLSCCNLIAGRAGCVRVFICLVASLRRRFLFLGNLFATPLCLSDPLAAAGSTLE
jgi:hypothetical protein